MASNTQPAAWSAVISSVRTPLGFFALLALVLDTVLVGATAVTNKISMWAPIGLLFVLIIGVFAIVLMKPYALYHPKDWPATGKPITVALIFQVEALQVDLDVSKCILEVRTQEGRKRFRGAPNLIFGPGGWVCKLAGNLDSSDSVRLELVEINGRRWKVNPFAPYEIEKRVLQLQ